MGWNVDGKLYAGCIEVTKPEPTDLPQKVRPPDTMGLLMQCNRKCTPSMKYSCTNLNLNLIEHLVLITKWEEIWRTKKQIK